MDKLWSLVGEEARAQSKGNNVAVIDVTQHGYFKVLGKGELPQTPLIVVCKEISHHAEKRIKAVGGAVRLVA